MNRIPIRIEKCPIEEAVFEIRFSSTYPAEAVFGVFYQILSTVFSGTKLIPDPILQLPEAVRNMDPNLIYRPHHRLQRQNHGINIGPRVMFFSYSKPYEGWNEWYKFIENVLEKLITADVFEKIERTGLRYVNVFQESLLEVSNVGINLIEDRLQNQCTTLRTEINDGEFLKIIQLSNNVEITSGAEKFNGSALDINILMTTKMTNNEFGGRLKDIIQLSHDKEKDLFFNILTQKYIDTLKPEYGGET